MPTRRELVQKPDCVFVLQYTTVVCYLMPTYGEQRFLEIVSSSVTESMCSWAWAIQTMQTRDAST
jgi:hypothetical protein